MKVILYVPDYDKGKSCGRNATLALSQGLESLGVDHDVRKTRDFCGEIADVAIVNGWTKKMLDGKTNRNTVIAAQDAAGKPAWCLERGFIGDREMWSSLAIGGFCANGGDFRAEGMPPGRSDPLGIDLEPWCHGRYILLCAQVPWDAQVDDGNHIDWLEETAREIRKHTDRRIQFRQHPKAYRRGMPYKDLSAEFLEIVNHYRLDCPPDTDFEDELRGGAHAVVCFNSNVATLATVAGVPVFTGGDSLADPIACRDLSLIDDPPMPDREQWAYDLSYKQWHLEEFREAKPWLHLTR